jgi:hypothetical protein
VEGDIDRPVAPGLGAELEVDEGLALRVLPVVLPGRQAELLEAAAHPDRSQDSGHLVVEGDCPGLVVHRGLPLQDDDVATLVPEQRRKGLSDRAVPDDHDLGS